MARNRLMVNSQSDLIGIPKKNNESPCKQKEDSYFPMVLKKY
jgi:hypothetical protein